MGGKRKPSLGALIVGATTCRQAHKGAGGDGLAGGGDSGLGEEFGDEVVQLLCRLVFDDIASPLDLLLDGHPGLAVYPADLSGQKGLHRAKTAMSPSPLGRAPLSHRVGLTK